MNKTTTVLTIFLAATGLGRTTPTFALDSLRGAAIEKMSAPPARQKIDVVEGGIERTFEQQPPLIPHKIENYRLNLRQHGCLLCHSKARAYVNRTGVRATCPDCHVPREGIEKFVCKLQASREVYHHLLGTIDTPEKFDARRMKLAGNVWRIMKDTDSRECRNCHEVLSMDYDKQEPRSAKRHEQAEEDGLTCIDCHKGIAHRLPAEYHPEQDIPGKSIYYDKANTSL